MMAESHLTQDQAATLMAYTKPKAKQALLTAVAKAQSAKPALGALTRLSTIAAFLRPATLYSCNNRAIRHAPNLRIMDFRLNPTDAERATCHYSLPNAPFQFADASKQDCSQHIVISVCASEIRSRP